MDAYEKNEKGNISAVEEQVYKKFAKIYLSFDDADIKKAIKTGDLFEIKFRKK